MTITREMLVWTMAAFAPVKGSYQFLIRGSHTAGFFHKQSLESPSSDSKSCGATIVDDPHHPRILEDLRPRTYIIESAWMGLFLNKM